MNGADWQHEPAAALVSGSIAVDLQVLYADWVPRKRAIEHPAVTRNDGGEICAVRLAQHGGRRLGGKKVSRRSEVPVPASASAAADVLCKVR